MTKKVLFIMTYPLSDWELLVEKLKKDHNNYDFFQTEQSYHHPDDLQILFNNIHRRENSQSIWSDVILHNKDFTCRSLRSYCKFIYWNGPRNISEDQYSYRLNGMKWYYQKTGGLWIDSLEFDNILGAIY